MPNVCAWIVFATAVSPDFVPGASGTASTFPSTSFAARTTAYCRAQKLSSSRLVGASAVLRLAFAKRWNSRCVDCEFVSVPSSPETTPGTQIAWSMALPKRPCSPTPAARRPAAEVSTAASVAAFGFVTSSEQALAAARSAAVPNAMPNVRRRPVRRPRCGVRFVMVGGRVRR